MDRVRILLVDDNPAVIRTLSEYFSGQDSVELVGTAPDGLRALELIAEKKPDLMLLDLIMPGMDGFSVLEAIRDLQRPPKVIMVTGLSRDDFVLRAMGLGASYYMVKPVDPPVLLSRILEVAGLAETRETARRAPGRGADEQLTNLFLTLGIPAHIKGYQYLREAVKMVLENHAVLGRITKELYPGIARRYGTSSSKVERAMRHAIEVAWNRGRMESVNRLYGCRVFSPEDKPSNGEFIAMVADKIDLRESA